jgi:TonB family protein
MGCLWPIRRRASRGLFAALVLVSTLAANVAPFSRASTPLPPLAAREQNLRRVPAHTAEFAPVYQFAVSPSCANTRPPEALVTPDPMMHEMREDLRVRVSFIIGADGRVHSAFILDSGGRNPDRTILRAIGHWRYRPAICNGVPTPMEARVSFVLR